MTWNANIPATNAALLSAPLRENFQALDTSFYAPLTAATDGYLLYRAAGPTVSGEANLLWDATNNNLKLFGGGVGTSGNGVLALGPSTTAPTTSPVDTVQLLTFDMNSQAGSRALQIRDERGGKLEAGSDPGGYQFYLTEPTGTVKVFMSCDTTAGYLGTLTNHPINIRTNGITRLQLDTANGAKFFNDSLTLQLSANNAQIIQTPPGGHQHFLMNGGTGAWFGVGTWGLYDATMAQFLIRWASDGNLRMTCGALPDRIVTYAAADSAGSGWRYLIIQN
jgi:hypothetical protein